VARSRPQRPNRRPHPLRRPAGEEVIALPEFTVASDDTGWVATNALSGTRTNVNLRELPRSVQVMTSEFLADIGALTLTDASDYMSGITNVGNQDQTNDNNTYQVRGFRQNENYRDGQREPFAGMLHDSATMDRVEVVKGPSSMLSGLAEPGGAINTISKLPRGRRETSITVRGDNWACGAGRLIPRFRSVSGWRRALCLCGRRVRGWQQFAWSNRSVYYGALSFKVTENTRYTASAEYIRLSGLAAFAAQHGGFNESVERVHLARQWRHQRSHAQWRVHPVGFQPAGAQQPPGRADLPFREPSPASVQRPAFAARGGEF
jgi:outer membrane receptor for ferric coprogen and ferric-rhodotorulic acid